nr:hypothetical protein [uncultured Blautia sp.]
MSRTIFDDVFRTMVEKLPYLAVPLINEVFEISYPENVEITQLRNEHQQENGEIITDCCLKIGRKLYHIECQSIDDTTMAIRMIEYDFAIAIENAQKINRRYRIEFPRSCVIYLRSNKNTPDSLEVEVIFPDGKMHLYEIPTVKMENYTKDSIFEKNLLMLLPFYVMRYEKEAHNFSENPEKMQQLLNEYEEIRRRLNEELVEERKSDLYADLTDWIVRIADYIFRNEDAARKGINGIMRGKVLKLKSEELREEGREEERKLTARSLAKEGDSIEKIARVLHESEETIKKWIDEQAIEEERRRKEAESN